MIPPGAQKALVGKIEILSGKIVEIKGTRNLSGGCIHEVLKLETSAGDFCVKLNRPNYLNMFEAEARGLELLRETRAIKIPKVFDCGQTNDASWLLMEYLPPERPAGDFFATFGRQLAGLHQHSGESYGLNYDNYIGSLPQDNSVAQTWPGFFAERRLRPQFRLAFDAGLLDKNDEQALKSLIQKFPELFPKEPPSLLHGDLWNGNFLCTTGNTPALIDPAVYYGRREMDLAFSRLFGGFGPAFYAAYDEAYPLAPAAEERVDICNLYPLLVHVNLFGGSYAAQVKNILGRF